MLEKSKFLSCSSGITPVAGAAFNSFDDDKRKKKLTSSPVEGYTSFADLSEARKYVTAEGTFPIDRFKEVAGIDPLDSRSYITEQEAKIW